MLKWWLCPVTVEWILWHPHPTLPIEGAPEEVEERKFCSTLLQRLHKEI